MKRKYTVYKSLAFGGVVALLVAIYISLSLMYSKGFSYGTWINGEYCTGKTVSQVNEILKAYSEKPVIVISDKDGNNSYIYSDDYDYQVDYMDGLTYISNKQNPFLWIMNLFQKKDSLTIEPVVTYDEGMLVELVSKLPVYEKYLNMEEAVVKIATNSEGYYLLDTTHELLKFDELTQAVLELGKEGGALYVSNSFFYKEMPDSEEIATKNEWEKLQKFLATKIIYDMGAEQIPIDGKVLRNFLLLDDKGNFLYDESGDFLLKNEAIEEFVHNLCLDYDTASLPRKYTTYKGKEVEIDFELKSTLLNEAKEKEYLVAAVHDSVKEIHEPTYIKQGFVRGKNDVGDTFIEVDLEEQKLYFVKEGNLILETDIVSGNPNKGWTTPKMLCYIYSMSKNVVLRGEGYASPVDYWLPVYQGIGLHDASWQSAFGSDLYLTRGSRGCINLYIDDAKMVYENAYIGLPVIIY